MLSLHCKANDGAFVCTASPDLLEATSGFCELKSYELSIDHPEACKLLLDEVELSPTIPGQTNSWHWQPGFYAGTVLAELCGPSCQVLAKYRLDVSPNPQKLGQEEFKRILDQIFEFEPRLLLGSEAAQFGIGAEGESTDLNLEYARLRRYGSQLLAALKPLALRPLTQLHHDRALVPANQVRRLDPRSMIALARQPGAIPRLRGEVGQNGRSQLVFDVPRSREVLDTPAHRTLLRIVNAVLRRAQRVGEELAISARAEEQTTTRTALTPRMAYRHAYLSALESGLKYAVKHAPFNEVSRQEISATGLNAVVAHPAYSRVFLTCWSILRPGVAGSSEELLWMSPTWQIYERWCFLKTHSALKCMFPSLKWERHFPTSREDCIVFTSKKDDLEISLFLQPRFPAFDQPVWHSFKSLSGERIPDIVLTCTTSSTNKLLVFDAKYRVSRRGVLESMQSAHTYHDCLRWGDVAPAISLLFVPAAGGMPKLEEDGYRQQYGIGVLPLSRDTNDAVLAELISSVLCLSADT